MRRLFRASIWHPDAIPPDELKYRNLKRIWLPVYDIIAMYCGVVAVIWGSPLLNRLFPDRLLDVFAWSLAAAAVISFIGTTLPKYWALVMVGRVALIALISGYTTTALIFSGDEATLNLFLAGVLTAGLPMAFFHLNLLGEELKERRATA